MHAATLDILPTLERCSCSTYVTRWKNTTSISCSGAQVAGIRLIYTWRLLTILYC